MASIIKVDQIQTSAGGTPTAADLGINTTGSVINYKFHKFKNATQITALQTWVDLTGSSFTFTPASNNSVLYITVHMHIQLFELSGQSASGSFDVLVDGTPLDRSDQQYETYAYINSTGEINEYRRYSKAVEYTNTSTSAKTIKVQGYLRGGDQYDVNSGGDFYSYVIVQEIAG